MIRSFMEETRASIRNLEVQMGQLSKQIPERSASTFPGDTVVNSREDCKVIQLRSGKTAGSETRANEELVEKKAPEEKKEEVEHAPPKRADNPFPNSLDTYPTLPKAPEYKPKMPYPQRLQKASKEKQFSLQEATDQHSLCRGS
ncbi:Retrotransposon gag protein [Arachis hypogaea]|nr:Retrotransposon gag protein [Arachis hypogaea]